MYWSIQNHKIGSKEDTGYENKDVHFSPAIYIYVSISPSRSQQKFQRVFHETGNCKNVSVFN